MEKAKTQMMRRDMISLREFLPLTRHCIEKIVITFDLADADNMSLEEWAKMFFLMRQMPDNDKLFPSGKWATIQALESKLDEWAVGVATAVNPKGTLP
jgi:hypothetical protein